MHKSFCRPFIAAPAKQYSSALLKRFLAAGANWLPTVFALSSGRGKSGVAVIRVSGPLASKVSMYYVLYWINAKCVDFVGCLYNEATASTKSGDSDQTYQSCVV
eukprot:m.116669 g.116669  ORF g.116669 m.116669 type:complete len:104 (+) comp37582_c0_seq10:2-313(+)